MEAASFYVMQWNKRYSGQPDHAVTIVEARACANKKYFLGSIWHLFWFVYLKSPQRVSNFLGAVFGWWFVRCSKG
ncbi:hypothetical protein LPBF_06890 [Flavobacterium crassostreae]|uniref:Uncharacterized protein n=1 Tax=Flavobacterium crassostreae TaxID=1763534 RepID=A0A1B9E3Y3_9FLAO|nr:hypothetical protein LPBF_06890 [Flavobacterium crassostreae]